MEKITKELIDELTPLEKEAAEWCYQRFQEWVEKNKKENKKDKNYIVFAHLVFIGAHSFKPGELEAFKSLQRKGIIWTIEPDEEIGGDAHEIAVDDSIVVVHNILENSSKDKRNDI